VIKDQELRDWELKLVASPGEYAILNPDRTMEMIPTAAILEIIQEVTDLRRHTDWVRKATRNYLDIMGGIEVMLFEAENSRGPDAAGRHRTTPRNEGEQE
jgi:hypothetical protein